MKSMKKTETRMPVYLVRKIIVNKKPVGIRYLLSLKEE